MKYTNWQGIGGVIAAAAALACLVAVTVPLWGRVGLGLMAAGGFIGWRISLTRRCKAERNDQIIRMLNHHRHDWMNDLQVLFGYVQLNKFDKLSDQMDKIRSKALFDGYISRLGIPELIVYLFAFRAYAKGIAFEVYIEQEIDLRKLEWKEADVYKLIRGIMEQFASGASGLPEESGTLSVGFDREDEELLLDFVYQGMVEPVILHEKIHGLLRKFANAYELREEEYAEDKAVVALALPFRI